jgi:hypothetical protein
MEDTSQRRETDGRSDDGCCYPCSLALKRPATTPRCLFANAKVSRHLFSAFPVLTLLTDWLCGYCRGITGPKKRLSSLRVFNGAGMGKRRKVTRFGSPVATRYHLQASSHVLPCLSTIAMKYGRLSLIEFRARSDARLCPCTATLKHSL